LYYFSVLCKSFKERFLYCLPEHCSLKADAKVRLFFELPNIFRKKFRVLCKNYAALDLYQSRTCFIPFYILRARMRTAQKRLPEGGLAIQPELHRNSGRITRQFSLNHNAIQHELHGGGGKSKKNIKRAGG